MYSSLIRKLFLNRKTVGEIVPSLLKKTACEIIQVQPVLCGSLSLWCCCSLLAFFFFKDYTYSGDSCAKKDEFVSRWVGELAVSCRG